jgi:hypothetical protein
VVWNYTSEKFRHVDYAVGEFVRAQTAPDRTHVEWTYRFALKSGVSSEEESRFRRVFLERELSVWMRTQLDRIESRSHLSHCTMRGSFASAIDSALTSLPVPWLI